MGVGQLNVTAIQMIVAVILNVAIVLVIPINVAVTYVNVTRMASAGMNRAVLHEK
jgi:hypothetical protein